MEFPCCLILKMTLQTLKDLLGAVCALGLPRAHLALTAPLGPGPDAKCSAQRPSQHTEDNSRGGERRRRSRRPLI